MQRLAPILVLVLASCSAAPPSRSPLREQLAAADSGQIEDGVRACFAKTGWKVDPIPGLMGGARKVSASKISGLVDVYIYPPDMNPRITGGPDAKSTFWTCLATEFGGGAKAAPAESASE